MDLVPSGPDVWYAGPTLAFVGTPEIAFLKARATESARLRARICLHAGPEAALHEMVIVHHRSTYVRPHRHPSKAETLTVLEGRAAALTFDDAGAVVANVALDAASTPLWHVAANTWHGLEILSDWLVFYEVSPGPFHAGSSEFPAWAPASV